jgi:phosphoribosylglycinamide formyltransferase-1
LKQLAILISGRGSNMEAIARQVKSGCLAGLCEIGVVASNRAQAPGLAIAQQFGLATFCDPEATFESGVLDELEARKVDYVVLAGFTRILSSAFIAAYRGRILNIHPTDTARYQGLRGYRWAFEQQLEETVITVHYVDEGVDTGDVIAQRTVDLKGANSIEEIEYRGLAVEHELYPATIKKVVTQCAAS